MYKMLLSLGIIFAGLDIARASRPEASSECPAEQPRPPMPQNMMDYAGRAWPSACFNDTEEQHFFIIGDWGGTFPHNTFPTHKGRPVNAVDDNAQVIVAGALAHVAKTSKPKFIINVGDNIYPGGIGVAGTCNPAAGKFDATGQAGIVMSNTFSDVYNGSGMDDVEWWGVLGNHDFGGYYYSTHWDQFIFYTWNSNHSRWIVPALYWSRKVQYNGFSADFFFVDTNINDVKNPPDDPDHNICNNVHNKEPYPTCNGTTITSPETCMNWFQALWGNQQEWLQDKLHASDADWQIVVSHYPPNFGPASILWNDVFPKYGVDLYISGHTHWQKLVYKADGFGDTAYVVSGGGGGIYSEITPDLNGNDDAYGFVDVIISKKQLEILMYSHKAVLRNHTIVTPRGRMAGRSTANKIIV